MTKEELAAFSDELEKIAFPGGAILRRGARWLTEHGATRGLATGAGVGAVTGAGSAAARGGDTRDIVRGGLVGGLGGAALGGTAGGIGRKVRDVRLLTPGMTAGQTVKTVVGDAGRGIKNFGKRQLHGFTGAYKDQAGSIGLQSKELAKKRNNIETLRMNDRLQGVTSAAKRRKIEAASKARSSEIATEGRLGQNALDSGITSIPGIAKGLVNNPRKTMRAMWDHNAGKGIKGKAFSLAPAAAIMGPELAKGDESASGGKGMGQKLLNTAAFVAPGVALGRVPIVANMAGWTAADSLSNAPFRNKKKVQSA